MPRPVNLWFIVPAAGTGTRMGAGQPKQFIEVAGKTLLEHSIEALLEALPCSKLLVCVSAYDQHSARVLNSNTALKTRVATGDIQLVLGGDTRAQSVLNGLKALATIALPNDWVMVHDAARPCVNQRDLKRLYETLKEDKVGGILAVPAQDTLKQVDAGTITTTLERSKVWLAQTPQMFGFAALSSALQLAVSNGVEITDEASALEYSGSMPKVVRAEFPNPKITTPADITYATLLLEQNRF